MNEIKIDGLPLPQYLVDLISQERWETPSDINLLKQLTKAKGKTDIELLSANNMIRVNLLTDLFDEPKIARIYGLASSNETGLEIDDPEILDVDKAVLIGGNWNEEMICLDYRSSLENPRVVFSSIENKSYIRWKTIAKDIKDFADYLGLAQR